MSEYQYYEFRALDRSLTKEEMAEVRRLSTRAEITPTSFTNVYHFGSFKGEPTEMMFRWYDAHVYTANWGSHVLMFGFPRRLLDPQVAQRYLVNDYAAVQTRGDRVVIEFGLHPEDGGWWDYEEGDDWLDRLVHLRADIAQGDHRALYLAWLSGIQEDFGYGIREDDEDGDYDPADAFSLAVESDPGPDADHDHGREPPVPPGLRDLTEPLNALIDYLKIDQDLVAVAAERSADLTIGQPSAADLDAWLKTLPAATKDAVILRVLAGEGMGLRLDLLNRYRAATAPAGETPQPARKIGELLAAAAERARVRKKAEAERAAKEQARKEREAAAARVAYLDGLGRRQESTWNRVEELIEAKNARAYDEAIALLRDLRDLGVHLHISDQIEDRTRLIRVRHAKKGTFIARLDNAGL